jgi:hypothetical protein
MPYLGLVSHASVNVAPNAPGFSEERRHAFLASYREPAPYLMTVALNQPANPRGLNNLAALGDPNTWLDAISFLLQNWGGSADLAIGMQLAIRRGARFLSATATELPTDPSLRYSHRDERVFMILRRRLAYMRVVGATGTHAPVAAAIDWTWARWLKAMCATRPPTDFSSGALAAPTLAIINGILPGLTVANSPEFDPVGPIAATAQTDAMWHQFFSGVDLDGVEDEPLRDFLAAMTNAMQASMLLWLTEPFVATYGVQAAVGVVGDFELTIRNMAGAPIANADRRTYLAGGTLVRRDLSLPVLNFYENYSVTYPAGISAMRSLRAGDRSWHGDSLALELAPKLTRLGGPALVTRMAAIAIQWRAVVDCAAHSTGLSPAMVATIDNTPTTGSPDLDNLVMDTTSGYNMGKFKPVFERYLSAVSEGVVRTGYHVTVSAEHLCGVTDFRLPNHTRWQYPEPNAPRGRSNFLPLVVWRVLHPVIVQAFLPGAPIPALPLKASVGMLALPTRQSEAPWTSWDFSTTDMDNLQAVAAFRTTYAISGVAISPQLLIPYQGQGGVRLTYYEVAHTLSRRPGRLSDSIPVSPVASQDPLLWLVSPISYTLEHRDANGAIDYMRPYPTLQFHAMPCISALPPLRTYTRAKLGYGTARLSRPTIDWIPTGLGAAPSSTQDALAGMNSSGTYEYWDPALARVNTAGRRLLPLLGVQQGNNRQVMRSEPAYNAFNTAYLASISAIPEILTNAGVAVPVALFPAAVAQQPSTIERVGCNLAAVQLAPIPARGRGNDALLYLEDLNGYTHGRIQVLRLKISVERPPFVITDRVPTAPYVQPQLSGSEQPTPSLFSVASTSPLGHYLAGLGAAPADPAAPYNDTAITYSPPTVVDKQQFDVRHLQPGWSALSHSRPPLPTIDPTNLMSPEQRKGFSAYLAAVPPTSCSPLPAAVQPSPASSIGQADSDGALQDLLDRAALIASDIERFKRLQQASPVTTSAAPSSGSGPPRAAGPLRSRRPHIYEDF